MENNETNSETQAEAATVVSAEVKPKEVIDCLIHLRFQPDGTVSEIGERPSGIDAQTWFNYLSRHTHNCYQALSGGRGLFRLPRLEVDTLKSACVGENTA
jgi:hypothetical protein